MLATSPPHTSLRRNREVCAVSPTPERAWRRWKPHARKPRRPTPCPHAVDHREAGRLLPTAVMTTLRRHPAGEAANPRAGADVRTRALPPPAPARVRPVVVHCSRWSPVHGHAPPLRQLRPQPAPAFAAIDACALQIDREISSCLRNFKTLQDLSSYRIFERIYEILNVAKQNN